ncbi:hypothetical protein HHX47_DHR5000615 [Lentinula edodes]|nr:hypothetical protein HHX47_DHR5000615 [Lentinula edodes]
MKLFWIWLTFSTGLSLAVNPQRLTSGRLKQSVVPPQQWRKYSAPLPGSRIELRIGLVQPFMHVLENHIQEISDPDHERYGQHLSKSEVETLISPQEQSIQLVTEWLHVHGIEDTNISCTPAQDWIVVTLPISLAEKMLDTNYYVWQHDDGDFTIRTTSYNLPEHLFNHIDLIQPTTMFARLSNMKTTLYMTKNNIALGSSHAKELTLITPSSDSQNDCNYTVTLNCLQSLYNTVGYQTRAHSRNSIGLTGYLEQYANQEDLKLFFADQNPGAANASLDVILINGGFNNQSAQEAGDEANLDVQFALGLSYPTPGVFYSTGGEPPFDPDQGTESNTNEPYAKWLDYILSQDNPPLTISTSYGDHEQTVPEDYARRTCERFMALGARGVTLTFSSGDGGFDRPWYQDRAVNEFLETLGEHTYSDLFNRFGRAYPDVSAQGVNFRVFIGSKPYLISGTSASSPTFAGIVALLNDARLHAGLPPLGFLNPLLYKRGAEALNDVTVGNNPGCGTNGFNATEGWDPGLGTPNFEKLEKIVLESQMWKRSG